MPRVTVIATGGTIANRWDASQGGAAPGVTGQELVQAVPQVLRVAQVQVEQFSNVGSQCLTPSHFLELSQRCHRLFQEGAADGIVVTMGTATMAEYAYMLDLLLREEKLLVVTGAMRNTSLASPDGPRNILDAVTAAASPEPRGWGVLVCMNGELHNPRDVTKTHTRDLAAFRSWDWGPVGAVRHGQVILYRRPLLREHIPVERLSARVEVVTAVEGDDGRLVEAAAQMADGIVVVGFASGVVPPAMVPAIRRALERGRTVALVTRCPGGALAEGEYADAGAEARLIEMGALPGGSLSAAKARIKLMLALSATRDKDQLRAMFQNV